MIKRVVHIAENHEEAREWDIRQALEMSPGQRQAAARVLRERVYGSDTSDIRPGTAVKDLPPSVHFSGHILHFLKLLSIHGVQYLIVGGEAVIYYGYPRLTGDLDLFYRNTEENTAALFRVLSEFWEGEIPGITGRKELRSSGYVIQFGVPPNRLDLMNRIDGVDFESAWIDRKVEQVEWEEGSIPVCYIGLEALIRNKMVSGRPKDREDLVYLKRLL